MQQSGELVVRCREVGGRGEGGGGGGSNHSAGSKHSGFQSHLARNRLEESRLGGRAVEQHEDAVRSVHQGSDAAGIVGKLKLRPRDSFVPMERRLQVEGVLEEGLSHGAVARVGE